ncbi:MAG: 50S ribosomal protein L17 [Candidatus Nealsonbacteria bacterium]|nr:50S ribosomal protein L17 [Candidatus Nealsonbacteria bacterium]
MRKRKKGRKFSREKGQRKALLKTLAVSLIAKEKIKTTEAKAKSLASFIEKHITRARQVLPVLADEKEGKEKNKVKRTKEEVAIIRYFLQFYPKATVQKLIKEIAPKYKERKGGYTRIIKLGPRKSDSSRMAIIEFVK